MVYYVGYGNPHNQNCRKDGSVVIFVAQFLLSINEYNQNSLSFFSVFMGSYEKVDGPELYMIEPSGISYVSVSLKLFSEN